MDESTTNPSEQVEHHNTSLKDRTPPDNFHSINLVELSLRQKRHEIIKDPAFLPSPIYPPVLPTKPKHFRNRDDQYFLMIVSPSKHNSFALYASNWLHHQTIWQNTRLVHINRIQNYAFTPILARWCCSYFLFNSPFLAYQSTIWKPKKLILRLSQLQKTPYTFWHIPKFFNIKNHRTYIFAD